MVRAALLAVVFAASVATFAQAAPSAIQLPTDPTMWINSPPVSLDSLRGKAVVLFFFEEGCPSCAKEWPNLVRLARQNSEKPIVFIGVSSGTERAAIERYVHTNAVSWPVVLDTTRAVERAADVPEVSLQNIMQCKYISADGSLHSGNFRDLPGTVQSALTGAAWRVEPAAVPPALKPAWMAVELGDFASAAPMIKKAAADKKPEIKAAAEKLQAASELALKEEIAAAQKTAVQDKWTTYKNFRSIAERFKGFTLPEEFKTAGSALYAEEDVQKQLAAYADLEALKKGLNSKSPAVYRKSVDKLDKIISDHPGTEAADLAAEFKKTTSR